ncbi:MAG TPA: RsmG family class I SAM-dependent methyltransferase [Pyrinomonadaceae bacterium]|jgi:16S rRNA (guanine527-N7)-methyltransferase|nr:RsmG family class I SAM-dependent methyltransferase [Pyrinomonadaceae bacterium]
MATEREQFEASITNHAPNFDVALTADQIARLSDYYELLLKWNDRLHLVAPGSPGEFAIRHVLESLLLLRHLPTATTIVDIGSGGGLPIVPCLLVRDDLSATLIESSKRKAVFLREALRSLRQANRSRVIASRFEEIVLPASDFLTCRALDRFTPLLPELIRRTGPNTTFMLFAGAALRQTIKSLMPDNIVELVPHSQNRFLIVARKPGLPV